MNSKKALSRCLKGDLHPEAYSLFIADIEWLLFGTLTFKHPTPFPWKRRNAFIGFIREVASRDNSYFPSLYWVLKHERNPTTGDHDHLHFILSGLNTSRITSSFCKMLEANWGRFGGGHCKIDRYNQKKDGVSYVLKRSSAWIFQREPENVNRDASSDVDLSKALIAKLKS